MPPILDDPTIANDAALLRRISPQQVVPDENNGGFRPSSAAFDNDRQNNPMSVVLGPVLLELGRAQESALDGHPGFSLVAITAAKARALGQAVARDPLPNEPAHGVVAGSKPKSVRKLLAKSAQWIFLVEPSP